MTSEGAEGKWKFSKQRWSAVCERGKDKTFRHGGRESGYAVQVDKKFGVAVCAPKKKKSSWKRHVKGCHNNEGRERER